MDDLSTSSSELSGLKIEWAEAGDTASADAVSITSIISNSIHVWVQDTDALESSLSAHNADQGTSPGTFRSTFTPISNRPSAHWASAPETGALKSIGRFIPKTSPSVDPFDAAPSIKTAAHRDDSCHSSILNSEHVRVSNKSSHRYHMTKATNLRGLGRFRPFRPMFLRGRSTPKHLPGFEGEGEKRDDCQSPLLNPNAVHGRRTLDMIEIHGTSQFDKSRIDEGGVRVPHVLSPSFAIHRRKTPPPAFVKPPRPPSGSPTKSYNRSSF